MSKLESKLIELEKESKDLFTAAISSKLLLSIEERLDSHENARQLINDLSYASKERIAGSQEAS